MAKWILPFILLVGCGDQSDPDSSNYGYGYHYDVTTSDGLRVRYSQNNIELSLEQIAESYRSVAACMGVAANNPPLVIFVPEPMYFQNDAGETITVYGQYYYTGTVVVTDKYVYGVTIIFLRHEFVHHFLDINSLSRYDNANHKSSLFSKCEFAN